MKKFLIILNSFSVINLIFSVIYCCIITSNGINFNGKDNYNKENIIANYEKNKIIKQLTNFSELSPMIIDNNKYETIKSKDVLDILKNYFKEFNNNLSFIQKKFNPIKITEDSIVQYGNLIVNVNYKDEQLINPKSNNLNFDISISTNNLELVNDIVKKLNENMKIIFSEINIPIEGIMIPVKEILSLISSLKILKNLPTVIPTSFNDDDSNWKQWQYFVDQLINLPFIDKILENGEIDKIVKKNIVVGNTKIKIKTKYIDILNSLAPDIIHFHNFIIEKNEEQKIKNLILLFLKYLFEKPRNIKEDGFLDVNKNIESSKDKKQIIKFNTNLEHILHNLFEGWKNKNGKSSSDISKPISIIIKIDLFFEMVIQIKYEKIPKMWLYQINSRTEGIIDIFPIQKIKEFINELFNFDLTSELIIKVKVINWDFVFTIPIGSKIKEIIPLLLKIKGYDNNTINNNDIKLIKGNLQLEYKDEKNSEWKTSYKISDLLSALDLRININNIKFEIKSNNDKNILIKTTNKDLNLIFIPNIDSNILE